MKWSDNASHKVEGCKFENKTDFPIQSTQKNNSSGILNFKYIGPPKKEGGQEAYQASRFHFIMTR
jgi:hypothetical protein